MSGDVRPGLAQSFIDLMKEHPAVRDVRLKGSLASGTHDYYSDVDIVVDVSGSDNSAFAVVIPSLIAKRFPVIFYDWAPSLLPKQYVQSFYIEGLPIFWNVDVECFANPHFPSLTSVPINPADHFLKLWSLNAKSAFREQTGFKASIATFVRKVCGDVERRDTRALMKAALEAIAQRADMSRSDFVKQCYEVCDLLPSVEVGESDW